jgi:hypothetical protein
MKNRTYSLFFKKYDRSIFSTLGCLTVFVFELSSSGSLTLAGNPPSTLAGTGTIATLSRTTAPGTLTFGTISGTITGTNAAGIVTMTGTPPSTKDSLQISTGSLKLGSLVNATGGSAVAVAGETLVMNDSGQGNRTGTTLPTTNSVSSPVISNTAQKIYLLEAVVPNLQVGREIESYQSRIVINRPSPGDDYWYRLPYTISVVGGQLPEGLSLVQNSGALGRQTGNLACFQGTPTKAGTYSVSLRGTMADGIVTADREVQLVVAEEIYSVKKIGISFVNQRTFIAGKTLDLPVFFYDGNTEGALKPGQFTLKLSGLPPGTSYTENNWGLSITGTPTQVGTFIVSAEALASDGNLLGGNTCSFEIKPEDFKPARTLENGLSGAALRQFVKYGKDDFRNGYFKVRDELGATVGNCSIKAQGLPPGLSFSALFGDPAIGFSIAGASKEAGTFNISAHAVFEDGATTPDVTFQLQVLSAPMVTFSGNYDCLVERTVWNKNDGGALSIALTSNGAASGFLLHKFVRYPFASTNVIFDKESGDIQITPPKAGVVFKGTFQEDAQGYSSPQNPVFCLTGTLHQNSTIVASAFGFRATVRDAKNPSPYAGAAPINLMVVDDPFANQGKDSATADGTPLDPVSQPTGISFSALRISPTGVVTATVWAADGSAPVTVATRICETSNGARFFTYVPIANSSGTSSLIGYNFVNLDGDAAGTFTWFKNASNTGSSYPGGIALQEYSGVIGARYVAQPGGLNLFGLEESLANAELDLIGADLGGELEVPLTMSAKAIQAAPRAAVLQVPAKVTVVQTPPKIAVSAPGLTQKAAVVAPAVAKVATVPVASGMSVRYDAKTGMVTGSVNIKRDVSSKARTATFRGMLAPDGKSVMGHFTIPSGDPKKNLIYSGELRVKPRD